MRFLFLLILLLVFTNVKATIFHVAPIGGDFSTIRQVNAATFEAGDQVLFQRGQIFSDTTLVVSSSGSIGNPIVYGAYGTGTNPVITGFATVTAWTNLGGNIWESTNAVSTLTSCNMVSIDGTNTAMGRTPNLGSYYTLQSHNANLSITSNNLTGTPDWTGAKAVIRTSNWIWKNVSVSGQDGGTLTYDAEYPTTAWGFTPTDNWGFFIQGDIKTLDVQNEWYYNSTTKKISIYSLVEPENVKLPTIDIGIECSSKSFITIQDITVTGANITGINITSSANIIVRRCVADKCGYDGIRLVSDCENYTIDSNTVKNCNYSGIHSYGSNNLNEVTTNNIIDSTAMIIGIGRQYAPAAIFSIADSSLIQYNTIDHSGYNGMMVTSRHGEVRNNFINNSLLNRGDGGGIYTAGSHENLIIDGNIICNSFGSKDATTVAYNAGEGIYLDINSSHTTVSNNTVFGCFNRGIFINEGANNNTITNNTSYNNGVTQFAIQNLTLISGVTDNAVTDNKWVAKKTTQLCAKFQSHLNDINLFMNTSNGNCYARPISDDGIKISYYQPSLSGGLGTFDQWKTFSGVDGSSVESPFPVVSEDELLLVYNPTKSDSIVSLPNKYKDFSGAPQYSVTLQPYTSKVLFRDFSEALIRPVVRNGKYLKTASGKIIMK